MLTFRSEDGAFVYVVPPPFDPALPFGHGANLELPSGGVMKYEVTIRPFAVGDYSTTYEWVTTSAPDSSFPEGCTGTITTSLHVRIVPPDGGTD
jgi:hypothetical protein